MSADLGRGPLASPAVTDMGHVVDGAVASVSGRLRQAVSVLRGKAGIHRMAGGAFLMRVVNAGLGFATQIFLARWMGAAEYGVYAYVWVWLLFVGGVGSLGLPVAALKFVPDYTLRDDLPGLRGFLHHATRLGLAPSILFALAAGAALALAGANGGTGDLQAYAPVAILALVALPVYVLTDIQTGIARAYDFADLGLMADYLVRPVLTLAFALALALLGGPASAAAVMALTLAATLLTALVQGAMLRGRLAARVPAGPRRSEFDRWSTVSAPLLVVTTFTLLLGTADILLLKLFVGPAEIARYFAATKILAVASFVAYGVAATSSHRFAAQAVSGDRRATARLAAETVRWTFWPTLAVALVLTALARPLLALFGPDFAESWPVIAILSLGLLAQAAVGPADRALAMFDHGGATARIYAAAFAANIVLGLVLVPSFGLVGAALATTIAFTAKSAMLYVSVRRRLGLDMFVFAAAPAFVPSGAVWRGSVVAEIVTPGEAERHGAQWRDLAARTLEPNPFYLPGLAIAGLTHLPERDGARVLLAWDDAGGARRLVGLLPIACAKGRHANPFRIRRGAELYGTLSTPLLDPERAPEALAAMLDALSRTGTRGLLLPYLHAAGPAAAALDTACAARGYERVTLGQHARAMLRSPLAGADYMRATLETRRRKEADRQRRRLSELGHVAFAVVDAPDEVPPALEAFLTLESAGWKGALGTDLRSSPGAAAFIAQAAANLSRESAFRIATTTLDGRLVAAGLVAIAGRRAFYLKTTYDEALARFSPGLLLTLDITAHLLDDPQIDDADSIAVADHPMIDRVWTERFPVASVLVSTRPGGDALFRLAASFERLREDVRVRSGPWRDKLKAFRPWRLKDDTNKSENEPGR